MSAGAADTTLRVNRDLTLLAPKFRQAVDQAIAECNGAQSLDAYVYEAHRSSELQALYYARGRTFMPPPSPVTNARDNLYSWHGFGLAVDVVSESAGWSAGEKWFQRVADVFKAHGCRWGGDWKMRDVPHFQWGPCKPSPSDLARQIYRTQGLMALWVKVGAA